MATRYFAFGCSYVDSRWGTIADLIGANFDEYYNLARAGSCNTFSCNRLIEVDNVYKLNSDTDYVTIGVTGIGRFSFIDNDHWSIPGDIFHTIPPPNNLTNEKLVFLAKKFDSYDYAAYRSWIAIKTISTILQAKKIKHTIYPSIDNLLFITDHNLSKPNLDKVKDLLEMCHVKHSVDEFVLENYTSSGIRYNDGSSDTHPSQAQNYAYLKKYFSEFDTKKTQDRFEFLESIFDMSNIDVQSDKMIIFSKNVHRKVPDVWL